MNTVKFLRARIAESAVSLICVFSLGLVMTGATALAAPLVNNNSGTWTDLYSDNLGVSAVQQTVVDSAPGVVRLVTGQASGDFTTVRIRPLSFDGWKNFKLEGAWSASSQVVVTLLDSTNADTPIPGFTNIPYTGQINLIALSSTTYPEIKVRVALTNGTVSPSITATTVTWNPISRLLLDKKAAAEVQAGQQVSYRIRYSTSFVEAKDLVVWDRLPDTAQGTMTYPQDFGQNDNLTFVSATKGGLYTASAVTVKGISIPANSVYWDLGTVAEGTTDTLTFVLRSLNGTLDGTTVTNTASADAANAAAVTSSPAVTIIKSVPAPVLAKRAGAGIFPIGDENFTRVNTENSFTISAENTFVGEGRETMYQAVVYDNLSDLVGKMDPDFASVGIPVTNISPAGTYIASYTPPTGGPAFPAVVWSVGTMAPGAIFNGSFTVKLLNSLPLPAQGQYINTVCLDSARTRAPLRTLTPLCRQLIVKWPLDETPRGSFAKGDNLSGAFQINAGRDDDFLLNDFAPHSADNPFLYTKPGGTFPYGLLVRNNGLSAMNHVVMLDKIPANTTFKSAWFTDPWLQANAKVFYSLTDTANTDTPPAYDYTQAPTDLDPAGNSNWLDYSTTPPANPALVKWVAFYIPAVNSTFFDSASAGWIPGAPQQSVGYFDVDVSFTVLDPTPCTDKLLTNRGLFRAHEYTPINGGAPIVLSSPLSAFDDEPTRVSTDKPALFIDGKGSVSPAVLDQPGNLTYTVQVKNSGAAIAPGATVDIQWPSVLVNGSQQRLSFISVSPANISSFNPATGTVTLSLGAIPVGATVPISLTVAAPAGISFGSQLTFTSSTTLNGAACPQPPIPDQASAIAEMRPSLRVFKNDVLDLIPTAGFLDYRLTLFNTGDSPSHGTWVVDRVPVEMVFENASGPNGEAVWFSAEDNLPPTFLTPANPVDAATIASKFSPGIRNDNGTPSNPADDTWTSPFGSQTRWIAWNMDITSFSPPIYPVGQINQVGFRVKNDLNGPAAGNAGSPSGNLIFNTAGVFSDELLQAVGNEVITTIKDSPSILVQKTGPTVVSAGQTIVWNVSYYNNSGTPNDIVTVTDTLPAGVSFVSATHIWNSAALGNSAPVNNNGQPVATTVTTNPDGTTSVFFNVAGANGYRGNGTDLATLEGGTFQIQALVASNTPSGADLLNRVSGTATNGPDSITSSDEHLVMVRNAELRLVKATDAQFPVAGDQVTYTLIVSNLGLVPATNVILTDTLPTNMTFVTGSVLVLTPGYTLGAPIISGRTLTWSTATSNALRRSPLAPGILPATSGDVAIQYRVTVNAGTAPGTNLPNVATVTTNTPEDGTEPNQDDQQVTTPFPDPVIAKTGPTFVEPGSRFAWTLNYFNATRQPASGVYVIDTLPDYTGDGQADVTFIAQTAPAGVTAYYHAGVTTSVPAFNSASPISGGWSSTPTSPVNHIAWSVGNLGALAGPFNLTVTADAIRPDGGSPIPLPAGVTLDNVATIFLNGTDNNPGNNTDNHLTSTPGNDIALTKRGSTEGNFPGLAPGDALTYFIDVENTGTQVAYGIEVQDTIPAQLTLATPSDNFTAVTLANASGAPVFPLNTSGQPISGSIPVTRIVSGAGIQWFLGTNTPADVLYYRNIGLPRGAKASFQVFTNVLSSVANGTSVTNTATAILRNQDNSVPPEAITSNNTDTSNVVIYRPDLAIRKSVRDLTTSSEQWTEASRQLEYRIDYNNLGSTNALNSVVSEIVPVGTTLMSVNNPPGSTVTYSPGPGAAGATSFDVKLGTVNAPANMAGFPVNQVFGAKSITRLSNGNGGINLGSFLSGDQVGLWGAQGVGDIDGDGIPDIMLHGYGNDDGGADAGGVWILLLNANGTAKSVVELANGKNGIPAGSFLAGDWVSQSAAPIGDIDGDGVNDIALGAPGNDDGVAGAGAVWIVRLNSDGTAKGAVEIANGKGGMAAASLTADNFGTSVTGLGDIDADGVPDVFVTAPLNSDGGTSTGGGWLLLLNSDGTAKSTIELANGKNGVPAGSFGFNGQIGSLGAASADFNGDGRQDLILSNFRASSSSGGCMVLLLNANGTASAVRNLSNGLNGIPAGTFLANDWAGRRVGILGDIDRNGVPDIVLHIQQKQDGAVYTGGSAVVRMKSDGTALGVTIIANGVNGVPAGTFSSFELSDSSAAGDVDADGVPDLLIGSPGADLGGADTGGCWLMLLNSNGTVKAPLRIGNGYAGAGPTTFAGAVGGWVRNIGDINSDGLPDLLFSAASLNDGASSSGGAYVIVSGWLPPAGAVSAPSALDGTNVKSGQLAISSYAGRVANATKLENSAGGITANSFLGNDQTGTDVNRIGDIDGDGIADIVVSSRYNDDGGTDCGGAWVIRLNNDGTAKSAVELANGKNGIPVGSFLAFDNAGESVVGLGDVDGDGIPDIGIGAPGNDDGNNYSGAMWIVTLNANGTAKAVTELANGKNGIAAGYFLANEAFGNVNRVIALGDIDGDNVPDFLAGNPSSNDGAATSGGAWIIRLNPNGTAKGATKLSNGTNGIPVGSFLASDSVGTAVARIGDIDGDGVPDIALGSSDNDDGATSAGGIWIIRLNSNGTAKGVQEIANGIGGLPAGSLLANDFFGGACRGIGDIDADDVPDVAVGAFGNDDGSSSAGAVWVIRLNANGTAKSALELASGKNGITNNITVNSSWGQKIAAMGDVDGDGIPDLAASAIASDVGGENSGSIWVVLLNSDGSAKSGTQIQNGSGGLPTGSLAAFDLFGNGIASLGDINSDGIPDIAVGAPFADAGGGEAGSVWILRLAPNTLHSSGSVEKILSGNSGISSWDRLFSGSDIPAGTTLTYSIGRLVAGVPTYDLGAAFTTIPGSLPADGLDLSSLGTQTLVARVSYTTTQPQNPNARTPTLFNLFATYQSSIWPGFTFTVRVDDPAPFGQTQILNTASISTDTPETRSDNNSASDDINLLLTDLAVTKTVDQASVYAGDTVTYTLNWQNNGPQAAVNATLLDTLPAGFNFVSANPAPTTVSGQALTWNLGNPAVSAAGSITLVVSVNAGTLPGSYTNVVRIDNDRQETDLSNNDDSVPVIVVPTGNPLLANVAITKTGPATAQLGGTVTYTLNYLSNGGGPANSATVTDLLPAGLTYLSANPTPTSVSGQLVTWNLGNLANGASGSITLTATAGTNYLTLHNQTLVNVTQITTTSPETSIADNEDDHPVTLVGAPAAIGGFVWHDLDKDGVIDLGESPLPNVLITLTGTDIFGTPVTVTQLTGSDGSYTFNGLIPGTYQVSQTQPSGYVSTMDVLGTVGGTPRGTNTAPLDDQLTNIVLNAGDRGINYNFGEVSEAVSIGSFVWIDANNNGLQDSGETGLTGATVSLLVDNGSGTFIPATNLSGSPVASQTTSATGTYFFGNLPAGNYRVVVTPQAGYAPSTQQTTANNNHAQNDSNIAGPGPSVGSFRSGNFTLSPGDEPVESGLFAGDGLDNAADTSGNMTADFGFYQLASLGNLVWFDTNNNGLVNSGETGIDGITVQLYTSTQTPGVDTPVATKTTSGGGLYLFEGLNPGNYVVYLPNAPTNLPGLSSVNFTTDNQVDNDNNGTQPVFGGAVTSPVINLVSGENDLTIDFGFTCHATWKEWQFSNPLGGENNPGDNPDDDRVDNLLEYGLLTDPESGAGDGFCIRPSVTVSGTLEAVITRPTGASRNVTYILKHTNALSGTTTWTPVTLNSSNTTVVNNGNWTETVTIADLETLTGHTAGTGFVQLCLELDSNDDNTVDHTSETEVEGWKETAIGLCCQTYNMPFQRCSAFSGKVSSLSAQGITFTGENLTNLLSSNVAYYAEVISGDNAGQRFDIVSAAGSTVTLANDADLCAATAPFNTHTGAPPASLVGDTLVIRPHWTLAQVFPPASFGADNDQTEADQVQVHAGGTWKIYWLYANGGNPIWVDTTDAGLADKANTVLPPGQGVFFNNRTLASNVLAYGEVRENRFVRPLCVGLNLVGGGYPVAESTAVRGMTNTNFFGTKSFSTADSILIWNNDQAQTNLNNYNTRWLLNHTDPFKRWVKVGDSSLTAEDAILIFQGNRSSFIRRKDSRLDFSYPAPWTR